jgi:hypothetical protein
VDAQLAASQEGLSSMSEGVSEGGSGFEAKKGNNVPDIRLETQQYFNVTLSSLLIVGFNHG